jgi:thiol:disulfide interchange protein
MPKPKTAIQDRHFPKILILIGFAILVAGVIFIKNQPEKQKNHVVVNETAEEQLDRLLESGELVFAFIHSTDCQTCKDMMQTVDQVYPEFKDQIALVDVDVYDPVNQSLLQRAKISYIPTQIFIDSSGEGLVTVGAMSPDDFRKSLTDLLERNQ